MHQFGVCQTSFSDKIETGKEKKHWLEPGLKSGLKVSVHSHCKKPNYLNMDSNMKMGLTAFTVNWANLRLYTNTAGICDMIIALRHTVMAKNIGTLGKYDQRRLWKLICIVNPFDLLFKKSQKSNLSLDNKNLKWGEISLWNKCFSQIHVGHYEHEIIQPWLAVSQKYK